MTFKIGDIVQRKPGGKNGIYLARVIDARSDYCRVVVTKIIEPGSGQYPEVGSNLSPLNHNLELAPPAEPVLDASALADQVNALGAKLARTEQERDDAQRAAERRWNEGYETGRHEAQNEVAKVAAANGRLHKRLTDYERDLQYAQDDVHRLSDEVSELQAQQANQYMAAVAERETRKAEAQAAVSRQEAARLVDENMRLKAAIASTQTHLGNLVRDIHGAR